MPDKDLHEKYAVSNGPINRRTARVDIGVTKIESTVAQAKIQSLQSQQRLGSSLVDQIKINKPTLNSKKPIQKRFIAQGVLIAISAIGGFLGIIQSSVPMSGASLTLLVITGAWCLKYPPEKNRSQESTSIEVVAISDLAHLDELFKRASMDIDQTLIDKLCELKRTIVLCIKSFHNSQQYGGGANAEALYVREAIRRYIPDSILAYLAIPKTHRNSLQIEGNLCATDLLASQLDQISQEIKNREEKFTRIAGDALITQSHFLKAKAKQPL
jgi:hypothetical protein